MKENPVEKKNRFFETCSHPHFQNYWINLPNQLQQCIRWRAFFSITKEQFQPRILSNLLFFWRSSCRRDHSYQLSYQLWYLLFCRYELIQILVCYLTTSFTVNQFFYGVAIISREHLKQSILSRELHLFYNTNCYCLLYQVNCCYFEGYYVYLRKAIATLLFQMVLLIPQK